MTLRDYYRAARNQSMKNMTSLKFHRMNGRRRAPAAQLHFELQLRGPVPWVWRSKRGTSQMTLVGQGSYVAYQQKRTGPGWMRESAIMKVVRCKTCSHTVPYRIVWNRRNDQAIWMLRAEVPKFPVLAAKVAFPPTDCETVVSGWLWEKELKWR